MKALRSGLFLHAKLIKFYFISKLTNQTTSSDPDKVNVSMHMCMLFLDSAAEWKWVNKVRAELYQHVSPPQEPEVHKTPFNGNLNPWNLHEPGPDAESIRDPSGC